MGERRRLEEVVLDQRGLIDALSAESLALREESAALQAWLTTHDAQLQQKNSSGDMPAEIDAEVAWANVSTVGVGMCVFCVL